MAKRDYYEILGVDKTATQEAIKQAYRKIAVKWHPDKHVNDTEDKKKEAEEKFKEAAEAYSVLSDETKRKQYDTYGFNGGAAGGGFNANFNMDEFFRGHSEFFKDFGFGGFNPFSDMFFQNGGGFNSNIKQGSDLRITVNVTIPEIVTGVTKKLKYKRLMRCEHCKGTGSEDGVLKTCPQCGGNGKVAYVQKTMFGVTQTVTDCPTCNGNGKIVSKKCTHCNGEGVVQGEDIIEVNIPAGVVDGMTYSIKGKGNYPKNAGNNGYLGNLQILVKEQPHELFKREGNNIVITAQVDLPTAVLGGDIRVPYVDGGFEVIKVKPGTQAGTITRLVGMGIPNMNDRTQRGDFVIKINPYIPETLTDYEKETFERFKKSDSFKIKK